MQKGEELGKIKDKQENQKGRASGKILIFRLSCWLRDEEANAAAKKETRILFGLSDI